MAAAFDVWLLAANTVYKGVPFAVVADWAGQGRLAADDRIRPAGSAADWVRAADHPTVGDYLFVRSRPAAAGRPTEAVEPVEMDVTWKRHHDDEDDDPDMIPLIDISLVLLIFFMMSTVVSAVSPINVPEMRHPGELRADPEAITVVIDRKPTGDVFYALRVGDRADKADGDLTSYEQAIGRLTAKLGEMLAAGQPPPEVRIACHKELPSERVHEVAKELQRLMDAKKIAFYGAEVSERK
jgi:biopolymer transport protein ExbD